MTLNKEQEFLLNGIQELSEEEMISIAGGYGEPTTPGSGSTGHIHDDNCYWVEVANPYGGGTHTEHRVHTPGTGGAYGG